MQRPSVDGMLAEMTAREFAEWEAFYSVDPWGEQRADIRNAMLCSMQAAEKTTLEKFMPFPDREVSPVEREAALARKFEAIHARVNPQHGDNSKPTSIPDFR